jgi:hypothetical protein
MWQEISELLCHIVEASQVNEPLVPRLKWHRTLEFGVSWRRPMKAVIA